MFLAVGIADVGGFYPCPTSRSHREVAELDDRPRCTGERSIRELRPCLDASDAGAVVGVVVGGRADRLAVDSCSDGRTDHPDGHAVPGIGPQRGPSPVGQHLHADALAVLQQSPRAGVADVEEVAAEVADTRALIAEAADDPSRRAGPGEQQVHADGVVPPARVADDGVWEADVGAPEDGPLRRHLLQAVAREATTTGGELESALERG